MTPFDHQMDCRPQRTSPQPPPRPRYESRDVQKPDELLALPCWPRSVPLSMLTPVSITAKARMPPPRLSLMRKPRREPESTTRIRLSRLPVGLVAPVARQLPRLRFARP